MSAIPRPSWNSVNLKRHRDKHHQCFEAVLGITLGEIGDNQYAARAQVAITTSWLEYEAERMDFIIEAFTPLRTTYVDDDLIVAVTDLSRRNMITSYHEHFNKSYKKAHAPGAMAGDRRLMYREQLRQKEAGGLVRNLRRVRDV
jgi:hypothetical protein